MCRPLVLPSASWQGNTSLHCSNISPGRRCQPVQICYWAGYNTCPKLCVQLGWLIPSKMANGPTCHYPVGILVTCGFPHVTLSSKLCYQASLGCLCRPLAWPSASWPQRISCDGSVQHILNICYPVVLRCVVRHRHGHQQAGHKALKYAFRTTALKNTFVICYSVALQAIGMATSKLAPKHYMRIERRHYRTHLLYVILLRCAAILGHWRAHQRAGAAHRLRIQRRHSRAQLSYVLLPCGSKVTYDRCALECRRCIRMRCTGASLLAPKHPVRRQH
jgi:hypothetical protein